jgi:tRNA(Ile)-lysidine synthase
VIKRWLSESGAAETPYRQVRAVEALITDWRGQTELQLSGLVVRRSSGRLIALAPGSNRLHTRG